MSMYVYVNECVYVCMCVFMCVYECVFMCECIYVYVCSESVCLYVNEYSQQQVSKKIEAPQVPYAHRHYLSTRTKDCYLFYALGYFIV